MLFLIVIRLLLAVMCLGLALLVIVPVNSLTGWKLTLVVTEYGHRLALFAALLGMAGYFLNGRMARVGSVFLFLAVLLWYVPLFQALGVGERLSSRLEVALPLGKAPSLPDFRGLWWSDKPSALEPEVMAFHEDAAGAKRLFFYRAASVGDAPCIVLFHSGGWENGSATEFPEWSRHWAAKGFAVASIEYRLAPQHIWPAPLEDAEQAIAWLKANALSLGISGDFFITAGRSAGAQIASAVACGLKEAGIKGCLAYYGPHDMFFARRHSYEDDVLNSLRLVRNYMGGDPEGREASYTSASAYLLADESTCPMFLFHGTRDNLVWNMQTFRLDLRLRELGVRHFLLELPWATHASDWVFDGPTGQLVRHATDHFLDYLVRTTGAAQTGREH
jgi:acetyl esterase/lipase